MMATNAVDTRMFKDQLKKTSLKELVTPYKICLMVTASEYCEMTTRVPFLLADITQPKYESFTDVEKRDFMILIIKLLQSPDLELNDLKKQLDERVRKPLIESIMTRLQGFRDKGVEPLMDFFQHLTLQEHPSEKPLGSSNKPITKGSVLGLFIRRMILGFDKLSFSQITQLHARFKAYYDAAAPLTPDDDSMEKSLSDSTMSLSGIRFTKDCLNKAINELSDGPGMVAGLYSQKQAEYFISQQGFLLQHNEGSALPPTMLQEQLSNLLHTNPDLSEAHFLSYLNNLRVKEFCTTMHNLHHYFDRNTSLAAIANESGNGKGKEEDVCRRYAALNLAALYYRFGHKEESIAALHEAIRIAQEKNDHTCLQHALAWLHRLEEPGSACTASLMERSIMKSDELSIPYLASLGVQALAKHNAFATAKPSSVFDFLLRSDILNCQMSHVDFMCISGAQKAALWDTYGKSESCSMSSQLVMHLDTSENGIFHSGEAVCICMCNLAWQHAAQGQYSEAYDIINNAKKRFPQTSQYSPIWMACEQEIFFERTLLNKKWSITEQAVLHLKALNEDEAQYRQAMLYKEQGETTRSLTILQGLLNKCDIKGNNLTPDFQCRSLMLLSELYVQTGNYTMANNYILECITKGKKHHLQYCIAIATVLLGLIQLYMHLPSRAVELLDEQMTTIFTHGSLYDQARAVYCYVKCQVASAPKNDRDKRRQVLQDAANQLDTCIDHFKNVEAFDKLKDTIYYQARLYNELGLTTERNQCAYQFKKLDQQYPTLSRITVAGL